MARLARHSTLQTWGFRGQPKILLCISVTDILNQPAQQRVVIGKFSPRHVLSDDVAKHAPEIFVPRIRHERTRIRDHADETRQQSDIRERVDLRSDALLLIQEPPRAAVLDLSRPSLHPESNQSASRTETCLRDSRCRRSSAAASFPAREDRGTRQSDRACGKSPMVS